MNIKYFKNKPNSFPFSYFFIIALIVSVVSIWQLFSREYNQLLNQVKGSLVNFSQQKEKLVSQFLADSGDSLEFKKNKDLVNTIYIVNNGKEISMDGLRNSLYVEQQQKLRLNAYLVNDKGDLLTAQKEFDTSTQRTTTKIIRNELINKCLESGNSDQSFFYTGIDEGNRSVFGTYQKVSSYLPLCLFSETEKVTNIDVPAQQILKRYISFWLLFIVIITFLGKYLSGFSSTFSGEELISFILCGAAGISYSFLVTLITRGPGYFAIDTHLLEVEMATLSFSLLIIIYPLYKGRPLRIGVLALGIYFLLTIFFEEYRQAYSLSIDWRNFILDLLTILSIGGFLSLFFNFKKNVKL